MDSTTHAHRGNKVCFTMHSSKHDKFDPDVIVISSASDSEISDVEIGETLLLPVSPSKKVFTPTKR